MKSINPCPRCKSKMEIVEGEGGMKSFPSVSLSCSNKKCLWNMTCSYDEFSGQDADILADKMITQWNEGTK